MHDPRLQGLPPANVWMSVPHPWRTLHRSVSINRQTGCGETGAMNDVHLDQRLVDAAIDFVERRFPGEAWAGAAAMYTEDAEILISTTPDFANSAVALCYEVGAICDAYANDKNIVATVCVSRAEDGRIVILPACGVCQERLWHWGGSIEVAVPLDDDSTKWKAVTLAEMAPHYWRKHGDPRTSD
jgi:cytidine deaminase